MGGGTDVKEAYAWMIGKTNQCNSPKLGNFVVIRVRGNPDYDRFIFKLGPVASVQTLVVPTRETADDPALDAYIQNAAAIWITGGDQGDYYDTWKGTRLERLVHEQVKTHSIPVGGTSAGMMILSEFNYLASPYATTSSLALADPYRTGYMTLAQDFWNDGLRETTVYPGLISTITDSHFDTRDRMGRLATFLARVIKDRWTAQDDARAIGVDQETALLMEYEQVKNYAYLTTSVVANPGITGSVYFLTPSKDSRLNVAPNTPLTFTKIQVKKISANVPSGTPTSSNYLLNINAGMMLSDGNSGSVY